MTESIKLPPPENDAVPKELARRLSCAEKLERLLKSKPGEWLTMRELADVGGIGGWRTRLSELGLRKVDPLHIEWNGRNGIASAHRYLAYEPLGPSAEEPRSPVGWLFTP